MPKQIIKIFFKINLPLSLLLFSPILVNASGGTFAGGNGSLGSPWQIEDCADLQAINNDTTDNYVLVSNVDCTGVTFSSLNSLSGSLDGQNHVISNITISAGSSPYQGLFSNINSSAFVRNLGLSNISVTGGPYVGALAGTSDGNISKVFATGTISCGNYCGGLIGVSSGNVTSSYTNVAVSSGLYVGGVIGTSGPDVTISDLYAVGSVSGSLYAGGIIGTAGPEGVANSFYDQTTTGRSDTGDGTPKTTTQMKSISTFTNSATAGLSTPWDFVGTPYNDAGNLDIWDIDPAFNNGYPFFTWQYTDLNAPSAPSSFSATSSGASALLSWTNPTTGDFSSLTIRRSVTSFPSSVSDGVGVTSNTTTTNLTQSSLSEATYYYSIFALDNNGNISSFVTTTVTIDITAPSAPSDFSASSTSSVANLSWTNPVDSDFSSNMVRRSTSSYPNSTTAGTLVAQNLTGTNTADSDLSDGTYYYSIFAFDTHNNTSTLATTSVTIDTAAPVITLLGNSTESINFGQSYTDAGATANDAIDGSRTANIILTGSVNSSVAGTYTLTYNVSDSAGNAAAAVVRTVTVRPATGGSTPVVLPTALTGENGNSSLSVLVNGVSNEEHHTLNKIVSLSFNADPAKVKGYAVSLQSDFAEASILAYSPNVSFTLPDSPGIYNLYIKFYSYTGVHSSVIKRTIILDLPKNAPIIAKQTSQPLAVKRDIPYLFTRNLRKGMSGKDIIELQKFLNSHDSIVAIAGPGSSGQETSYFGNATAKAVMHFQELHASEILKPFGLTKGTGMFMNLTRALVNKTF